MPARKRQKKKAPAADWRTPLFYWRGIVSQTASGEDAWQGTWVASAEGLPCDAEFSASQNAFKLLSSEPLGMLAMTEETCSLSGSYKLDNGDGPEDHSDVTHRIRVLDSGVVGARGTTEFGEFVSLGRLEQGAEGLSLTLARRYIDDDDPRCSMSAAQVAERLDEAGPDSKHVEAPWCALPWKVADDWPAGVPMPAADGAGASGGD